MEDTQRYNLVLIILHWLMAALILFMFGLGWYMSDLPDSPLKHILFTLHKSTGLSIFLILLFRVYWRLTRGKPRLPAAMPSWQRQLAEAVQFMMYVLLVTQPLTGYLSTSFSGYKTNFWGIPLPAWGWKAPALNQLFTDIHSINAAVLFTLVLLHVCGALAHLVTGHVNVLPRMLPFLRTREEEVIGN